MIFQRVMKRKLHILYSKSLHEILHCGITEKKCGETPVALGVAQTEDD